VNTKRDLIILSELYALVHESMSIQPGGVYKCKDLFLASNHKIQKFYYVKSGFDVGKIKRLWKKYKKKYESHHFEVYGFMNLTNPKMEYHFNYLFRLEASEKIQWEIQADPGDLWYNSGTNEVPYKGKQIQVPEGNDEALNDEMQCDYFLPAMNLKPKTREAFGDIFSNL